MEEPRLTDRIYLDHAATTPVDPEVLQTMLPFFSTCYGNPSSVHGTGREAKRAVEQARKQAASALGASNREVFFTSGGSESDNWAIRGTVRAHGLKGRHIITTSIEHHAVLHTCRSLEREGFEVTYLPVDGKGFVNPDDVSGAIRKDTILISVMAANNEIGTIEPIEEIGRIAREHEIAFHTDAVQAAGAIPLDFHSVGADLLSVSGHKLYGPKGIGALFVRDGFRLDPFIFGGAQERSLRAGTENVPAIVGFGKAMELMHERGETQKKQITALRDLLIDGIQAALPDAVLHGDRYKRLPGNCCFSFPGVEGEALLLRMDLAGIAASSGSACTSGSLDPSHVLKAIGLPDEMAGSSLRMTIGAENTREQIEEVIRTIPPIVRDLQALRSVSYGSGMR